MPSPKRPLLLAHYMPWSEADPAAKRYGWHWTMNRRDPNRVTDGQPEIASKYNPLIAPYDSGDPDALEYHVLLMKIAGIGGVIVDWYGDIDFNDYAVIHRNTQALVRAVKKAGLRFCVCYEDSTVPKLIAGGVIVAANAVAHGQTLMARLEAGWFADPAYATFAGKPVFMVFGSGYYTPEQWTQMLAPRNPVAFFTQDYRRLPAVGAFAWPNPRTGTVGVQAEGDRFYALAKTGATLIPVAFPRFDDYYKQAGVHDSYGNIADRGGATLRETLDRAAKSGAAMVQLATWNDWGEGTQIEPSAQHGYRDLEIVQATRRRTEPGFAFGAADLRLPLRLHTLRKRHAGNAARQKQLDAVFALLCAGKGRGAATALNAL